MALTTSPVRVAGTADDSDSYLPVQRYDDDVYEGLSSPDPVINRQIQQQASVEQVQNRQAQREAQDTARVAYARERQSQVAQNEDLQSAYEEAGRKTKRDPERNIIPTTSDEDWIRGLHQADLANDLKTARAERSLPENAEVTIGERNAKRKALTEADSGARATLRTALEERSKQGVGGILGFGAEPTPEAQQAKAMLASLDQYDSKGTPNPLGPDHIAALRSIGANDEADKYEAASTKASNLDPRSKRHRQLIQAQAESAIRLTNPEAWKQVHLNENAILPKDELADKVAMRSQDYQSRVAAYTQITNEINARDQAYTANLQQIQQDNDAQVSSGQPIEGHLLTTGPDGRPWLKSSLGSYLQTQSEYKQFHLSTLRQRGELAAQSMRLQGDAEVLSDAQNALASRKEQASTPTLTGSETSPAEAQPSPIKSFGQEFVRSLGPLAAAGEATAAAEPVIGPAALAFGPGAPVAHVIMSGGMFLLASMGLRKAQDALVEKVAPESFMGHKATEADYSQNPGFTTAGGLFSGGTPSPTNLFRATQLVQKIATAEGREGVLTAWKALQAGEDGVKTFIKAGKTAEEQAARVKDIGKINATLATAAGAGMFGGQALAEGKSWEDVGKEMLLGTLFTGKSPLHYATGLGPKFKNGVPELPPETQSDKSADELAKYVQGDEPEPPASPEGTPEPPDGAPPLPKSPERLTREAEADKASTIAAIGQGEIDKIPTERLETIGITRNLNGEWQAMRDSEGNFRENYPLALEKTPEGNLSERVEMANGHPIITDAALKELEKFPETRKLISRTEAEVRGTENVPQGTSNKSGKPDTSKIQTSNWQAEARKVASSQPDTELQTQAHRVVSTIAPFVDKVRHHFPGGVTFESAAKGSKGDARGGFSYNPHKESLNLDIARIAGEKIRGPQDLADRLQSAIYEEHAHRGQFESFRESPNESTQSVIDKTRKAYKGLFTDLKANDAGKNLLKGSWMGYRNKDQHERAEAMKADVAKLIKKGDTAKADALQKQLDALEPDVDLDKLSEDEQVEASMELVRQLVQAKDTGLVTEAAALPHNLWGKIKTFLQKFAGWLNDQIGKIHQKDKPLARRLESERDKVIRWMDTVDQHRPEEPAKAKPEVVKAPTAREIAERARMESPRAKGQRVSVEGTNGKIIDVDYVGKKVRVQLADDADTIKTVAFDELSPPIQPTKTEMPAKATQTPKEWALSLPSSEQGDRRPNVVDEPYRGEFKEGELSADHYGDDPYIYENQYINPNDFKEKLKLEGLTYEQVVQLPTTQKYIEWFKAGETPPPIDIVQNNQVGPFANNRRRLVAAIEAGINRIPARVEIGRASELIGKVEQKSAEPEPHSYKGLQDIYGHESHPSYPDIAQRRTVAETAEKGAFGKFGEMGRKSFVDDQGQSFPPLSAHKTLRDALGLPDMPEYGDSARAAEIRAIPKEVRSDRDKAELAQIVAQNGRWSAAAQHTMDALADAAGIERSSMAHDDMVPKLIDKVRDLTQDPTVHESFARTLAATNAIHDRIEAFLDHPEVQSAIDVAQAEVNATGGLSKKSRVTLRKALESAQAHFNEEAGHATLSDDHPTRITDSAVSDFITDLAQGNLPDKPEDWLGRQYREKLATLGAPRKVRASYHDPSQEIELAKAGRQTARNAVFKSKEFKEHDVRDEQSAVFSPERKEGGLSEAVDVLENRAKAKAKQDGRVFGWSGHAEAPRGRVLRAIYELGETPDDVWWHGSVNGNLDIARPQDAKFGGLWLASDPQYALPYTGIKTGSESWDKVFAIRAPVESPSKEYSLPNKKGADQIIKWLEKNYPDYVARAKEAIRDSLNTDELQSGGVFDSHQVQDALTALGYDQVNSGGEMLILDPVTAAQNGYIEVWEPPANHENSSAPQSGEVFSPDRINDRETSSPESSRRQSIEQNAYRRERHPIPLSERFNERFEDIQYSPARIVDDLKEQGRYFKDLATAAPLFGDGKRAINKYTGALQRPDLVGHTMNADQIGDYVGKLQRDMISEMKLGKASDGKTPLIVPTKNATVQKPLPFSQLAGLSVHPEIANNLNSIFGQSAIRQWQQSRSDSVLQALAKKGVNLLEKGSAFSKLGMLGFSPFHIIQEGTHAIGHHINPFGRIVKFEAGNPVHEEAIAHGLMLGHDSVSEHDFSEGLKSGGWVDKIPIIGPLGKAVSDFTFKTYIPSLKLKTYAAIVERNTKRFAKEIAAGQMKASDIKYLSARQVNDAYGHLSYKDIGASPTVQHLLSLGMLAPDFFFARLRFTADAAKGVYSKSGREQALAMATLAATTYIGARIANALANDGDMKFKHPFSVVHGNREYTMRSVPEDIYKAVMEPGKFMLNRVSPVAKTLLEIAQGKDYRGLPQSTGQALIGAAKNVIPMTFRPGIKYGYEQLPQALKDQPGIKQFMSDDNVLKPLESMFGGFGVQTKAYTPTHEATDLANDYAKSIGKEDKGIYAPSRFSTLKDALLGGDDDRARTEIKKFQKTESPSDFARALNASVFHPYLSDKKDEAAFMRQLTPDQKRTLSESETAKRKMWLKFLQLGGAGSSMKQSSIRSA